MGLSAPISNLQITPSWVELHTLWRLRVVFRITLRNRRKSVPNQRDESQQGQVQSAVLGQSNSHAQIKTGKDWLGCHTSEKIVMHVITCFFTVSIY